MENSFYVYTLINSLTEEPFYVGKGTGNRINSHFSGSNKPKTRLHRKIAKLKRENIMIKQQYCENEYEAFVREIHLIFKFGRMDLNLGPLLNFTDGGEGMHGHRHSKEAREKISEAGRNSSQETRQKISNALKGRKRVFSEKHKLNIALGMTGKKASEESKQKLSRKMKGRIFSEQQKQNMSDARKGIIFSDEHKKNISEARKRSRKAIEDIQ